MGEGPYQASLVVQVAALGVLDRLYILPRESSEDVAAFMSRLSVLALLARVMDTVRQQFSRVIIKAQVCGTPVVGSGGGAIIEVVGKHGWIMLKRSPVAVAALLDQLAAQPLGSEAAWALAMQQAGKCFSFTRLAETLQ